MNVLLFVNEGDRFRVYTVAANADDYVRLVNCHSKLGGVDMDDTDFTWLSEYLETLEHKVYDSEWSDNSPYMSTIPRKVIVTGWVP